MQCYIVLFVLSAVAVSGLPAENRIQGGHSTSITQYPFAAALLRSPTGAPTDFRHTCGGVIINGRSILTVASCVAGDSPSNWRVRVGSSTSTTGGRLLNILQIRPHANFNEVTGDFDIAMLRTAAFIDTTSMMRAASLPSSSFILGSGQAVWAVGWGSTFSEGAPVPTIRHVRLNVMDQTTCATSYRFHHGITITANMVCAGFAGRGQCEGDAGGPLVHNGVVVGIFSKGGGCVQGNLPGINTRLSRFTTWINNNRFTM